MKGMKSYGEKGDSSHFSNPTFMIALLLGIFYHGYFSNKM